MCGIAGFLSRQPFSPSVVSEMSRQIAKRGPDAMGIVRWDAHFKPTDGPACNALIAARLAIIDPRPVANQPLTNEAGDIWIAYNGELYGWKELASCLASRGVIFRSRCDTELVLRAFEEWGIDMIGRLRGMFAISILDLRNDELWLVRDRMGQKPLVYSQFGENIAFGSTVRSVLAALGPEYRNLSPHGIDAFLAHRYVPAPSTILERVSRLENGRFLRFDLTTRTLERHRYWTPSPVAASLGPLLESTVRDHAVADRPLGLFPVSYTHLTLPTILLV